MRNLITGRATYCLTLAACLALAAGCSKDAKKVKTPATPTDTAKQPASTKQEVPAAQVSGDQKVSQGLAVSPDLAAACGIKAAANPSPSFDYDKDQLSPEDRAVLDQIGACLTTGALKGKGVALIGRADPRGTEEYNLGLGSRRADTVSQYLSRLGVGAPQLAVTTRGALEATGTDESGWAKDRRVDIQMRPDTEPKQD